MNVLSTLNSGHSAKMYTGPLHPWNDSSPHSTPNSVTCSTIPTNWSICKAAVSPGAFWRGGVGEPGYCRAMIVLIVTWELVTLGNKWRREFMNHHSSSFISFSTFFSLLILMSLKQCCSIDNFLKCGNVLSLGEHLNRLWICGSIMLTTNHMWPLSDWNNSESKFFTLNLNNCTRPFFLV